MGLRTPMTVRMQLLSANMLVLFFFCTVSGISYRSTNTLVASSDMVAHTQKVISEANELTKLVLDMETGQRGFMLTGNNEFLEPYLNGKRIFKDVLKKSKILVEDNPSQVKLFQSVGEEHAVWLRDAGKYGIELKLRVIAGTTSAKALVYFLEGKDEEGKAKPNQKSGKDFIDGIRGLLDRVVEEEESLLRARVKINIAAASFSKNVSIIGTLFSAILAIFLNLYMARRLSKMLGAEPAELLAVSNQISRGVLSQKIVISDSQQVMNVAFAINQLVDFCRLAANEADLISQGDFTGSFQARSSRDVLGLSLQKMTDTLKSVSRQVDNIADGNYDTAVIPRSEKDILGIAVRKMAGQLRENELEVKSSDWLKLGLLRISDLSQQQGDLQELSRFALNEVCQYIGAEIGALYLLNDESEPVLTLASSYAYTRRKNLSSQFKKGEGLVGQSLLEMKQILVSNVPDDYIRVTSGLGECTPTQICVTPIIHEGRISGVIEIGNIGELTDLQLEYLAKLATSLGLTIEVTRTRATLASSLVESQQQAEELQVQQEELRTVNEELEEQTKQLSTSQKYLTAQQEELRVANEGLEEKNSLLERQKRTVEHARRDIEEKAEELALASKYKSEFLANMSHELRTPLNSLLLLSSSLADNKEQNLTDTQVESAGVILSSGKDLLSLIDEILDLAKIEAGRMNIHLDNINITDVAASLQATFQGIASEKGLNFHVEVMPDCPERIFTDEKRLRQIVKNLVSNAIKFTEEGAVKLRFSRPTAAVELGDFNLSPAETLAVQVEDTGVGIKPDQQRLVFEAFKQADGGLARKHGGTGLGLSISRELAQRLGGDIELYSSLEEGSTFTLYLPIGGPEEEPHAEVRPGKTQSSNSRVLSGVKKESPSTKNSVKDDQDSLEECDKPVLVVEDDPKFAKILYDHCRDLGFKCIVAGSGEQGIELSKRHTLRGVILDLHLPGIDGIAVLDALKSNFKTRHIPVHVMSAENATGETLRRGVLGHSMKPVGRDVINKAIENFGEGFIGRKKVMLIVEDDERLRQETVAIIGNADIVTDEAATAAEAMEAIRSRTYDCVVLDLGLPDMGGAQLLEELAAEGVAIPPIIIYTAKSLTHEEEIELREYSKSMVLKDVRSPERLIDEVSLFLHQAVEKMPERKKQIITDLHDSAIFLRGKKILVVDDDMRTLFAMSQFLGQHELISVKAGSGKKALEILDSREDIDLVLMDIMMPEMDGYEATRLIRSRERYCKLPILALTAKAMRDDRDLCIAAGANDYLAKPVDQKRLLSMLRVWLYR
jgi:signal transduction histidine kinase/CheY-like chemotaxis protein/CHASE3 domain sensor protein